ncbi:hypothetical protein DLM75_03895 [Leptospira stimsonii]|uniref:Uncharacterized protein n=1 Tax=Leptospira stimsonii TaxID=2202203 RepID=A0A396ZA81_9LEPT|nr:hypothetical protein DLM75_03895 [Leptospira stimsonii]
MRVFQGQKLIRIGMDSDLPLPPKFVEYLFRFPSFFSTVRILSLNYNLAIIFTLDQKMKAAP